MVTKDALQTKRTPSELRDFVESTFDSIRSDPETRKIARLRRPPFKELIEEVYPLSVFCDLKYHDSSIQCCPIIGNQGYDATIESDNGDLLEIVELTWPIDGQKAHYQAVQLNDNGHTELEIRDVNDNTQRNAIIEIIIETASKKALKDYQEQAGSSLVFILNIAPYFGMHKIENKDDIAILTDKLKEIEYKVQSVYLLLLPIKELRQIK